jgi:hypothetical protein
LRFFSASKWILACCFIAAAPGHFRAWSAEEPSPGSKQLQLMASSQETNPDQPTGAGVSAQRMASQGNQTATPDTSQSASSTGSVNLPNAPSLHVAKAYVPLTGDERWRHFWKDTLLSPLAYVGAFGSAFGERLADRPQQWANSFSGYAKGAGVNLAQFGAQESIHQGGAALMHTDPRFLPCRCSGGLRRTWYALEMSFLTYKDDGSKTFDVPQLAGAYGGAMIAETMYPSRYSPLVQGVQNGHIQVGANVAMNLVREFSPELSRLNPFRHHAALQ